ncbi:MAG: hypothetical protein ABWX73_12250 [Marmoricola sp.]
MSYFPRAARLLVVLALAGSALAVPPAAVAADQSRPVTQVVRPEALAVAAMQKRLRQNKRLPKRASITFIKNWKNPHASRLTFRAWAKAGPKGKKKWVPIEQATWRAGSGLGGKGGRDECRRNTGWLPNGSYSFVQRDRRKGPMINGRVFELSPKVCRNGTQRQLLFIHSEQSSNNTQCRNRKGDDVCRWELPQFNDYRSNGCIKMSPGDLKNLTRRFHRYFRADARYPTAVVKVRVRG